MCLHLDHYNHYLSLLFMEKFGESEIQQSSPNLQKKLKSICKTNWTQEQEIPPSFHVQIGEIKKKDFRQQYWTAKEDQIYLQFLEDQGYKLRYKSSRKGKQIFSLLSEKMGKKRTAAQCKSHHQKMKKATQNGTIKEIIAHVKARHWSKSFDIKKLQIPEMCAEDGKPAKKKVGKYTEVKIILDVGSIAIW